MQALGRRPAVAAAVHSTLKLLPPPVVSPPLPVAPLLAHTPWSLLPCPALPFCSMKVKASIKKLCEACRIVKRRGRLYVVCKENPKVGEL